MIRLALLGPPGAGKGTQGRRLAERFGLYFIATGDIFRFNAQQGTELGAEAKAYMDAGELVPDALTLRMVMRAIEEASSGFVLDGFPRNIPQAQVLETELAARDMPLSAAIAFVIDEDLAVKRIAGRRTCATCQTPYNVLLIPPRIPGRCDLCGGSLVQRSDEDEETVRRRLEVYRESTAPLLKFYSDRGLLREVDADGTEAEVAERTVAALSDLTPDP